jgi:uncharacterized repeat protein (TIGR01451 family)
VADNAPQGIPVSKNNKVKGFGWTLGVLVGACLAGHAFAQAASPVHLTNAVYQEIDVKAKDGKVTRKLVPAARVVPGSEVVYEIAYSNDGTQNATGVTINNPVPKGLELVGEGVTPATSVSVDGGVTYGKLADLFVLDAKGEPRPARTADVTNLRWDLAQLAPGAKGKVTFRARVK